MSALDKFYYKVFSVIRRIGIIIAIIVVFAMMFYITADVLVRNFLPINMVGTYEFSQAFMMPLIGFPAMPYAYQIGLMPRIVMLTEKMSHKGQRAVAIILPIIHVCFFVAMAIFSCRYAMVSMADNITVLCGTKSLIIWPLYFLPVYSFFMIAIEDLCILIKNLKNKERTSILYIED